MSIFPIKTPNSNLICIRFLCYGAHSKDYSTLHPTPSLTGVGLPLYAYACVFSDNTSKPPVENPRHYIYGKILTIEEAYSLMSDPPAHLRYQAREVLQNIERGNWKAAVLGRLVQNSHLNQAVFQFRDEDRVITPGKRYSNAKILKVKKAKEYIAKTRHISKKDKERLLLIIDQEGWKEAVLTQDNKIVPFRPGDEIFNYTTGEKKICPQR